MPDKLMLSLNEARTILSHAGFRFGVGLLEESLKQEKLPFGYALKLPESRTWSYVIYQADLAQYIAAHGGKEGGVTTREG